ncbi:MAG: hypothetical protein J0M12_17675 [Deltaproteobacteria bacterium]|nr:hypothetical protein [Deltaproteobacteria bacterium]
MASSQGSPYSLPEPQTLISHVARSPELRPTFLRSLAEAQLHSSEALSEIAGINGEKLPSLSLSAKRRAIDTALAIAKAGYAGSAIESAPAEPDPYGELSRLKPPPPNVMHALRESRISPELLSDVADLVPSVRVEREREQHRAHLTASVDESRITAERLAAVRKAGGLRYDRFVELHQFGPSGFYSEQLEIASDLGKVAVATPMAHDPQYREMLATHVLKSLTAYAESQRRAGRDFRTDPLVFVEVGGGAGYFKRAFCDLYDDSVREGWAAPLRYISIDINHFQRLAQILPGTSVQAGNALETGLAPESVDFLFNEEVPDCFPHRCFKWDGMLGRLTEEAYVVEGTAGFEFQFREVPLTPEIHEVEQHLRQSGYKLDLYRYTALDRAFWSEAQRVIRPRGVHMFVDYTQESLWRFRGDQLDVLGEAINLMYNDITRGIDPLWMKALAVENGFTCSTAILPDRPRYRGEERAIITAIKRPALRLP